MKHLAMLAISFLLAGCMDEERYVQSLQERYQPKGPCPITEMSRGSEPNLFQQVLHGFIEMRWVYMMDGGFLTRERHEHILRRKGATIDANISALLDIAHHLNFNEVQEVITLCGYTSR